MASASRYFSPGLALNKIGAALATQFAAALAPIGIRPTHFGVLRAVEAEPGVTQQDIGIAVGVAPSWVMSNIDELEGLELLERRMDQSDRRKRLVHLTPQGRATLAKANAVLRELDATMLTSMNLAQREQFILGIQDLASFLELDI